MIFFRVSQNINIKTTDGTLVKYFKLKEPSNLNNETVYITTYDDFEDIKEVFKKVDEKRYKTRLLKEDRVRAVDGFPIELGISNKNEYLIYEDHKNSTKNTFTNDKDGVKSFLQSTIKVDISEQLEKVKKNSISLAIIGSLGNSIGEMLASTTALRILNNKLKEVYEEVKIDLYIQASNNTFYSRDKSIYENQDFINKIKPLSINSKELCEYDFFIDNSLVSLKSSFYTELNYVDAWLYKFGIDYKNIPDELKYNYLDVNKTKPSESLITQIKDIKKRGKVLLFHPYSANIEKSIPQAYAVKILKKLIKKLDDYIVVSTLQIDPKFKDDRFIDISKESKSFNDFLYIVSNMDAIVSANTSTYHISDAFMIPSVVIFTQENSQLYTKYYEYVKTIKIIDESKSYSQFIFDDDSLVFDKFSSWESFKTSRIIKLLESFWYNRNF